MKKRIAVLSTALLLFALASSAYAKTTQKRGVIEFCELYMYRYMKLQQEADLEFDVRIVEPFSSPTRYDNDTIKLNSVAGTMSVNTTDYTLERILMILSDLKKTDEEDVQHSVSCMMALSALEYNQMDELKLKAKSILNGGSETASEEAFRLFTDELSPNIIDAMPEAIKTGKEIKVYSGNYDYYLAYNAGEQSSREFEYLYLIAQAHE